MLAVGHSKRGTNVLLAIPCYLTTVAATYTSCRVADPALCLRLYKQVYEWYMEVEVQEVGGKFLRPPQENLPTPPPAMRAAPVYLFNDLFDALRLEAPST